MIVFIITVDGEPVKLKAKDSLSNFIGYGWKISLHLRKFIVEILRRFWYYKIDFIVFNTPNN